MPGYEWANETTTSLVDTSGRFFYTNDARYDFKTGEARAYALFVTSRGNSDFLQLCWLDHPPAGSQAHFFSDVLLADRNRLVVHMYAEHSWQEFYFAGTIGGAAKPPHGPAPKEISSRVTTIEGDYPSTDEVLRRGDMSLRIPASRRSGGKLDLFGTLTNGVDWKTREAWFYAGYSGGKRNPTNPGIATVSFREDRVPHLLPFPDFSRGVGSSGYRVLADHSIIATKAMHLRSDRPAWMKSEDASVWFDPKAKRWLHYDGLIVAGTSTDGRYVAYLLPPWKDIHLAKVAAR